TRSYGDWSSDVCSSDLADVPAQAIVGHAAVDAHLQVRHVGELDRVVGRGEYRFGQVQTDLALDHVESGRELDGVDGVTAQVEVRSEEHTSELQSPYDLV